MRNCSARRLTANAGSSVTNTYSYNRRRLLTAETMTPDTLLPARTLGYGYDRQGQVVVETYPDAATVRHTRNALGQVTAITTQLDGGAEQPTVSTARYYPNGALAQFTYGNGIVHTMTQNARQLPARSTDGAVLDLGLAYDGNGNVSAITDGTAGARQTRSMAYDGLDRLVAATSPMFGAAAYAYDVQDNLTRVQVTGGGQPRDHYYCYNVRNQLEFVRSGPDCNGSPAVVALGYDAQGNLAFKNGRTYTFDAGNRLRSAAGQGYRYDAQGRRVRSDVGGAQRRYSLYAQDGRLLWQRDEVAGTRSVNVYLAGSLVAEYRRPLSGTSASVSFLHTDPLGSPIAKTDAAGAVVETSEYEPYGLLLNRANDDRPGYTGHVQDSATGLTYMQQRYYDPAIGRFLSVDPVTAYSNPVGAFNRYWYANNNPYRFKDPDGRKCTTTDGQSSCTFDEFKDRQGKTITREQAMSEGSKLAKALGLGRGSRILRAEAGMTAKYTAARALAAKNGEVTIKGNQSLGISDQKVSGTAIVGRMETMHAVASAQSGGNSVASVPANPTGGPSNGPITFWKDGASAPSSIAQTFGHEVLHTLYDGSALPNRGWANPNFNLQHQTPFDDASDEIK